MDKVSILNQIINNISNSPIIENPFPHKFVENILPSDLYDDLQKYLPKKNFYESIKSRGTVSSNYSDERFVFDLTTLNEIQKLPEVNKNFFMDLREVLFSEVLFSSVTSNFKKILDQHISSFELEKKIKVDFPNLKFNFRLALIKDFTKYSLGAHTDTFSKFVSFLFYIPINNELKAIGTSLYKPKKEIKSEQHFNLEQTKVNFEKVKTCPFISNSVLIFPRTEVSFHGVEEVNINQKERNLLLLNYYMREN